MSPPEWPRASLWFIFQMMINVVGSVIVGGDVSRPAALDDLIKQAEQAMDIESVSRIPPGLLPQSLSSYLTSLSDGLHRCRKNKPFSPQVAFDHSTLAKETIEDRKWYSGVDYFYSSELG